jgi:hypothetical protein
VREARLERACNYEQAARRLSNTSANANGSSKALPHVSSKWEERTSSKGRGNKQRLLAASTQQQHGGMRDGKMQRKVRIHVTRRLPAAKSRLVLPSAPPPPHHTLKVLLTIPR